MQKNRSNSMRSTHECIAQGENHSNRFTTPDLPNQDRRDMRPAGCAQRVLFYPDPISLTLPEAAMGPEAQTPCVDENINRTNKVTAQYL